MGTSFHHGGRTTVGSRRRPKRQPGPARSEKAAPTHGAAAQILALQRTAGNAAVLQLLRAHDETDIAGRVPLSLASVALQRKAGQAPGRRTEAADDTVAMVKVTIAGSGYEAWATHTGAEDALPADKRGTQAGKYDRLDTTSKTDPTRHKKVTNSASKRANLVVAGPGAQNTKGWKGFIGGVMGNRGASDEGSNSVRNLVDTVPNIVRALVAQERRRVPGFTSTVIYIKAHSRGSVAASRIAKILAEDDVLNVNEIELVLFDPVPGKVPLSKKKPMESQSIDLSGLARLKKFALVYSVASGYKITGSADAFNPQHVFGAKTIILSKQSHSAGLKAGFRLQAGGDIYKGSRLNSLPEGVYVDLNNTGSNRLPLRLVASLDQVHTKIAAQAQLDGAETGLEEVIGARATYGEGTIAKKKKDKVSDKPDPKRTQTIKNVLANYFQMAQ